MHLARPLALLLLLGSLWPGCGGGGAPGDGGPDTDDASDGTDSAPDGFEDGGADAGPDAAPDGAPDAGLDGQDDGGDEVGRDGAQDAGYDDGGDGGGDTGSDGGDENGDNAPTCSPRILGYDCSQGVAGRPLGGGEGYASWIDPQDPCAKVVSTREELLAALAAARFGDIVYVADDAVIDLGPERDREIAIPEGVTLASGRGRQGSLGALLFSNQHDQLTYAAVSVFVVTGPRVRITGLRLRGPDTEVGTTGQSPMAVAVRTSFPAPTEPREVEVDNCELWGWPNAAVSIYRTDRAMVHHNFFHHNRRAGYGYGVVVNYAFPVIGANVFDHNRHGIAATGYPTTSYEACHNLILPGATSTSFDMHGGFDKGFWPDTAGTAFSIHHNLFLAAGVDGIGIRGVPIDQGRIDDNQFVHSGTHADFPSAVWQRFYPAAPACLSTGGCVLTPWPDFPGYQRMNDATLCRTACEPNLKRRDPATLERITMSGNSFGLPHRTAYFASFGGQSYWSFRRFASLPIADLAFGDLDGDGTADGFCATGSAWQMFPSLREEPRTLRNSSIPQADLAIADLDGDGTADVFHADGTAWWVFRSGTADPERLNTSGVRRASLHLADFDGDGRADVFRAGGGAWQVSWAARSAWQTLNTRTEPLEALHFGDFDGDGRADVMLADGVQWKVSWGGSTDWEPINTSAITAISVADLDGDERADVFSASGGVWRVSWAGRSAWQTLQESPDVLDALGFADVNGDGRADVLSLR